MEKEIIVRVLGRQYDGEDADEMEVVTTGIYHQKNGNHYIFYKEMIEGFEEPTRNTIKIMDGGKRVRITKKGVINAQINLEQGKSNQFVYTTPYGQISVGTKVEELECEITEERIFFSATYAMEVNYEYVAHNLIRVEAVNRTKG